LDVAVIPGVPRASRCRSFQLDSDLVDLAIGEAVVMIWEGWIKCMAGTVLANGRYSVYLVSQTEVRGHELMSDGDVERFAARVKPVVSKCERLQFDVMLTTGCSYH
jgi:hypothetical protein